VEGGRVMRLAFEGGIDLAKQENLPLLRNSFSITTATQASIGLIDNCPRQF